MEKYRGLDAATLNEMLAISTNFQDRKNLRSALRDLTGLKLAGDSAVTLSFGADTVKKLSTKRSPGSSSTPGISLLNSPEEKPLTNSNSADKSLSKPPFSLRVNSSNTPRRTLPRTPDQFDELGIRNTGDIKDYQDVELSEQEQNRQRRFRTYLFAGKLTQPYKESEKGTEERKIVAIKSPLQDSEEPSYFNDHVTAEENLSKLRSDARPTSLSLANNLNDLDSQRSSSRPQPSGRRIIARRHHVSASSPLSPISASLTRGPGRPHRNPVRSRSVFESTDSPTESPRSETSTNTPRLLSNASEDGRSLRSSVSSLNDELVNDSQDVFHPSKEEEMRESDSDEEFEPTFRKKKVLLSRKQRVEKTLSGSGLPKKIKSPREDQQSMKRLSRSVDNYSGDKNGLPNRIDVERIRSYSQEDSRIHDKNKQSFNQSSRSSDQASRSFDQSSRSGLAVELRRARQNGGSSDIIDFSSIYDANKSTVENENSKKAGPARAGRIYSREPTERRRSSSASEHVKDFDSSYQEREKSLQDWREKRERRLKGQQIDFENDLVIDRTSQHQHSDLLSPQRTNQNIKIQNQINDHYGIDSTSNRSNHISNQNDTKIKSAETVDELPRVGSRFKRLKNYVSSGTARDEIRSLRRSQSEQAKPRRILPIPPVEQPVTKSAILVKKRDTPGEERRKKDGSDIVSPRDTSRLIERLVETEAALQEALRKTTNFTERRKLRAEVRQIREQRTDSPDRSSISFLEGSTESHPAAVVQRSASISGGEVTPAVEPELSFHYDSNTSIEELRRQLSQTADYDEKRKIRLALRQMRQGRDGAFLDNGRPPTGLQRSQSCIDSNSSSRRTEQTTPSTTDIKARSSSPLVLRSKSVTEQPIRSSRASDQPIGLPADSVQPIRTSAGSDADNYSVSRVSNSTLSRQRQSDSSATCDTTKSNSRGDKSYPLVNGHSGIGDYSFKSRNSQPEVDKKTVSQSRENSQTQEPIGRSSLDKLRNLLKAGDTDTTQTLKSRESQVSPKDQSHSSVSFRKQQPESSTSKSNSINALKNDNEFTTTTKPALKDSILSNLAKRRIEKNEKSREKNLTPTDQWLEEKKKLSPTPCEVSSLLSTMDIEAAFSEILDAVEKPTTPGALSEPSTPDSVIAEEDSSGENSSKSDIVVEKVIETHVEDNLQSDLIEENVFKQQDLDVSPTTQVPQVNSLSSESEITTGDVGSQPEMEDVHSSETHKESAEKHEHTRETSAILQTPKKEKNDDVKEFRSSLALDLSPAPDKNGAVSVIHGDDGTVTVQEVKQVEKGDTVVTEWRKLRRTRSKTEEREVDTVVETKLTSPGGSSSIYEKDVTKSKRKLTSRGSDYFQRNNYNIRRLRDLEGSEIIEQEVTSESDNVSVSKGKSWGDKSEAKVTLSKNDGPSILPAIKPNTSDVSTIDEDKERLTNTAGRSKALTPVSRSSLSKTSSGYGSVSGSDDDDVVETTPLGRPSGCPEILATLKDVSIMEGNIAVLECSVLSSPLPTVTWFKGDKPLSDSQHHQMRFDGHTGVCSLTIQDTDVEDLGQYRCVFYNPLGQAETVATLEVKQLASGLPSFLSTLKDLTIAEGQSALLECMVADSDSVSWYKDGIIQRNSADFKHMFDGTKASLKIGELFLDDEGVYACALKNKNGEIRSTCKISVTEGASDDLVVPMFLREPQSQIVDEEQSVILEADVIGSPQPIITWSCDGRPLDGAGGYKMSYDARVARLIIKCAIAKDAGKYECLAENTAGKVSADCQLVVEAKPKLPTIAKPLADVTVDSAKDAVLECCIVGTPVPTISWRKNGRIIAPMFDFKQTYVDNIAKLEISKVCKPDSGWYECVGTSYEGEISTSCLLTVQDAPAAAPAPAPAPAPVPVSVPAPVFEQKPETREEHVMLTSTVQKFSDGFSPKMDMEQMQAVKAQASKVMLVRQSSLRSLKRDNTDNKVMVKRSESVRIVPQRRTTDTKQQLGNYGDILKEETVSKPDEVKAVVKEPVPEAVAKQPVVRNASNKDVTVENVSIKSVTDNLIDVSAIDKKKDNSGDRTSEHSRQEPSSVSERCDQTDIKAKVDIIKMYSCKNTKKSEDSSFEIFKDGGKFTERDLNDNDITLTSPKVTIQKVSQNGSAVIQPSKSTDIKTDIVVVDKKTDMKSGRSRVLEDLESMCSEFGSKKDDRTSRIKTGSDLRRSQSVKTPTGGKPEWLEFKLRKVSGTKTPVTDIEKRAPVKKAAEKKEEEASTLSSSSVSSVPSPASTPKTSTITLGRSQSVKHVSSPSSSSVQTKSSPSTDNSKAPIRLTPVSERARMFQSNDNASPSQSPSDAKNVAATSIIAKALGNLNRTESLKSQTGMRGFGVQRSQSMKIRPSHVQLNGSSEHRPANIKGEKPAGDSCLGQKLKIWEGSEGKDNMDYSTINDEEQLHKLLNDSENFETRKKIRGRIRELRDKQEKEWEVKRQQREKETEDLVRKKYEIADQEKKKKMEAFKEQASHHTESRHLEVSEQRLKDKMKAAEIDKQKKLEGFDRMARHQDVHTTSTVHTEVKDGKSVTVRKTESVSQVGGRGGMSYGKPAEETAKQLTQQIINESPAGLSGTLSVKVESWNSTDGVTNRSEKTESWGAKPKANPMNAFKAMDAKNNPQTNPLVAYTFAKRAATTMRRNVVTIKQDVLAFCMANTAEFEKIEITNFSTSWNDGIAFCALIHHFYPDSFDFSKLDPKNRRQNFDLAFDTAEKEADIAPLLDVEDMVRMKKPDWKCVFTYVQSFYRKLRDHERNKAM